MNDTYVVETLDQARVLVDPLRLRLLRAFAREPRTTKQVAEELGEKPTRLYRHVDALREIGLLEVKEERRKRGTVERYLQAVARRFAVNPSLFEPDDSSDGHDMVRDLFRTTELEAVEAMTRLRKDRDESFRPLIARFGGAATEEQFADLRAQLLALIDRWSDEAGADHEDSRGFGGMIAIYPNPPSKSDST